VRRRWILLVVVAAVGLAGAVAWVVTRPPTAAQSSLGLLRVSGYERTGQLDEGGPGGNSDSTGVYIGPVVAYSHIASIVDGPGVNIKVLRSPSAAAEFPGTIDIARGDAPGNCGLFVSEFQRAAQPYSWFGISQGQLQQVRAGQLAILLLTSVCGSG
jgi:hypothetical protein